MTELLYMHDAYVKEFDARVTGHEDGGVVLDRTAFYPGGGGQPYDTGTLHAGEETWQVEKVKRVKGRPVHYLARLWRLGDRRQHGTAQGAHGF
jgi:misacylated tRNA(Ala) deacylase